jgi:hypothetical protein
MKAMHFLFLLFIIFSCNTVENPNTNDQDSTNNPKNQEQVAVNDKTQNGFINQEYTIPKEVIYYSSGDNFLKDKFYPVGWSSDGKIAFITEFADEACGCYSMKFEVQDMIRNKMLWKWDYNDKGAGENLKIVWNKNYDMFKKQLNNYQIVQGIDFKLSPAKFIIKNKEYTLLLDPKTETDENFGFEVITEGSISLKSQNGIKEIWTFKETPPSKIIGAIIAGHIKSAKEDLIAVIYRQERRGYEGPPHVVTFLLSGCIIDP